VLVVPVPTMYIRMTSNSQRSTCFCLLKEVMCTSLLIEGESKEGTQATITSGWSVQ
ncbi:mCG1027331, partial [Mus musculus]